MNAWTPPAFDDGRGAELDRLIKQNPQKADGRPSREKLRLQNQHQRRIAYLRRGGRHAEADAEIAANDQREAFRLERSRAAATFGRDRQ